MNTTQIVEILGMLTAAWTVGFSAGYVLTRFKDAINMIV